MDIDKRVEFEVLQKVMARKVLELRGIKPEFLNQKEETEKNLDHRTELAGYVELCTASINSLDQRFHSKISRYKILLKQQSEVSNNRPKISLEETVVQNLDIEEKIVEIYKLMSELFWSQKKSSREKELSVLIKTLLLSRKTKSFKLLQLLSDLRSHEESEIAEKINCRRVRKLISEVNSKLKEKRVTTYIYIKGPPVGPNGNQKYRLQILGRCSAK